MFVLQVSSTQDTNMSHITIPFNFLYVHSKKNLLWQNDNGDLLFFFSKSCYFSFNILWTKNFERVEVAAEQSVRCAEQQELAEP